VRFSGSSLAHALASALGVVVVLGAGGCTLTTTEIESCRDNTQCRERFGLGFVCRGDGLCEESPPRARCASTYPEDLFDDRAAAAGRIVIGNLMDRSLATHRARERSARLAFKQANDEGGIEDHRFAVVFCTIEENDEYDDLTRSDAAITSARYLVDELGVPAIVGPAASGDTQATFLEIRGDDVLMISPSATSPALSQLKPVVVSDESPGLLWRTAPPDSLQGAAIASDMRLPGVGRSQTVARVGAIYESGAYGEGLYVVFAEAFTAAGGAVTPFPYENAAQRDAAIASVASGTYDEVLFVSSQADEVVAFLDAAAVSAGYDGMGIFLTDAAANADVIARVQEPSRFDQVRGTRPAPLDENEDLVYASFLAAYAAEYGEDVRPFSFTAHAYDAAWLVAYGAAWARLQEGSITGTHIARGLRKVSDGEPLEVRPTNWNRVKQLFSSGQAIDVRGASGDLDYDLTTEELSARIEIWQIQGDAFTGVYVWNP
jgi:ABC-type branched-subunit amino acid transport system substrate-binding protein